MTMLKNGWQMAASPQSDVFLYVCFFVVVGFFFFS